jgi:hypothetical protein
LHDLGQGNLACFDQQMNVIAHQHVCIDAKTISLPIVFQSFQ